MHSVPRPSDSQWSTALYIQGAYDLVWAQIVRAENQAHWFSAPGLEFSDQVGGRVAWGLPNAPIIEGSLEMIEHGVGIRHTFAFQNFGFEEQSTVDWAVHPAGQTVFISVLHDFPEAPQTGSIIGSVGWPKALARLKTWVETGKEMSWPDEAR